MTSKALGFALRLPQQKHDYDEAVNNVFKEVSTALREFAHYTETHSAPLLPEIHNVLVCFVKLCAQVVNHRQGRKRDATKKILNHVIGVDKELEQQLQEFKNAMQNKHYLQATLTHAMVGEVKENTGQTNVTVQAIHAEQDRPKILRKIGECLSIPPTVNIDLRTTQTREKITAKCARNTGQWIWKHSDYREWTGKHNKAMGKSVPHVLLVLGPQSSGKTCTSAQITKRLEQVRSRTYVAHYFFPVTVATKKPGDEGTVAWALRYMAFQIARVDTTVRNSLDKACNNASSAIRQLPRSSESEDLGKLWGSFGIGLPGSNATYYLVFDGLNNLAKSEIEALFAFVQQVDPGPMRARNLRILLSGQDHQFNQGTIFERALKIRMGRDSREDVPIIIQAEFAKRKMLMNCSNNPRQAEARDLILDELPNRVNGNYAELQLWLDRIEKPLSSRNWKEDLIKLFSEPARVYEATIESMEQALKADEIDELNELLKHVIFRRFPPNLKELEAAMLLHEDTVPGEDLETVIKTKYSTVLKLKIDGVEVQEGIQEYLAKKAEKASTGSDSLSRNSSSISMALTLNNVDQNRAAQYFWDLTQMVMQKNFTFDFNNPLKDSNQNQNRIRVNEFEAHLTFVDQAFRLLRSEPQVDHQPITNYLVEWLPYHLMRRDDKEWLSRVLSAPSLTQRYLSKFTKMVVTEFLRDRSWKVFMAYQWVEELMAADSVRAHSLDGDTEAEVSDKWGQVSEWCREVLGLPTSSLNSLWYERLAAIASLDDDVDLQPSLLLYERAIQQVNPSWLCYRDMGIVLHKQDQTEKAIDNMKMALSNAEDSDAEPKPEATDIAQLHLLLGDYAYKIMDMESAERYYLSACKSVDTYQSMKGLLGCLKSKLNTLHNGQTRQWLCDMFPDGADGRKMRAVFEMMARDSDHDDLFPMMFAVLREDHDVLQRVVSIMVYGSSLFETLDKSNAAKSPNATDNFAEEGAHGILLYYAGIVANTHKTLRDSRGSVFESTNLWTASRNNLTEIRSDNAIMARSNASSALARHYFQLMLGDNQLKYTSKLEELKSDDLDHNDEAVGLLVAIHALRDQSGIAQKLLKSRLNLAMNILSDDTPDNDYLGFYVIHMAAGAYQDLENAAIAMSLLGQPDLVTDALHLEDEAIGLPDGFSRIPVLEVFHNLARETISVAIAKVPNVTEQYRRIQAANVYIENEIKTWKSSGKDANQDVVQEATSIAYDLIKRHLNQVDLEATPHWSRDGRTADGKHCKKQADFRSGEFYHCLYCWDRDFCQDCFNLLRDPASSVITVCNAEHKWLQVPAQGTTFYVGRRAKAVRRPSGFESTEDGHILVACYDQNQGDTSSEITVQEWMKGIKKQYRLD
ncbi:hypothetical protein H9Q74_000654 [Fusarium xylarioides]|nr:hypothetical protein H9Q71_001899 [Fusarium xylarioides]KAG5829258.1 hypothetical protein H9Q74_000654 [Fusarium xylarioides]